MKAKSIYSHLFLSMIISLVLLMLGSCNSNAHRQTVFPSSTIPTGLPTISDGLTAKATASPLPELTDTAIPSPSMESTWTPLATIPAAKIDTFIDSLSQKCELPCWGNIIPGQTSTIEAKHILSAFGTIIEETSIYFAYHQTPVVIDLTEKNGKIDSINLPPELTALYTLNRVLSHYGLPQDIRIQVIPETAEGTPWFYLTVAYPQKGILALFSGQGKIINSTVNACFGNATPNLYLVKANAYSSKELNAILDPALQNMLKPLESLTAMTQNQFYDVYHQSPGQCLATTVQVP